MNNSKFGNRTIAIMSGKGGSGKTSLIAAFARILSLQEKSCIIVDADLGTGGMTYYLGLKLIPNKKIGLVNRLEYNRRIEKVTSALQEFKKDINIRFYGLGSPRLMKKYPVRVALRALITMLKSFKNLNPNFILVDCRGGIDEDSLQIATAVDEIILIAEPDTTSFQATQHLSEILVDRKLGEKITGFFINKVFINPSAVATNGRGTFGGEFLSAIPLDLEAMRSFLSGDLPPIDSLFTTHVWHGLHRAYPESIGEPKRRELSLEDYAQINTLNPISDIGGVVISFSIIIITIALGIQYYTGSMGYEDVKYFPLLLLGFAILALANGSRILREVFGILVKTYISFIKRLLIRL